MTSSLLESPAELLSENGPFKKTVSKFQPRSQQQEMADAVFHCIQHDTVLLAEAGTGVGKTFAYLVPAILSGQKIIISTGTKNLQDQLFKRDLPVVQKTLRIPVQATLLKGRKNYICLHRLEQAQSNLHSAQTAKNIANLALWVGQTKSGETAEFINIPEDDPVWFEVTSTNENCLGQDCEHYDGCFVYKARREAQTADVIVINHHLLLSDMTLRDTDYAELLPTADAYIIDEAHQLPDIASNFFGVSMSSNQLLDLLTDIKSAYLEEINESGSLIEQCDELLEDIKKFRLVFGNELKRGAWTEVVDNKDLSEITNVINDSLPVLCDELEELAKRSKILANCLSRSRDYMSRFETLTQKADDEYIHWFETHKKSISIHLTPIDIGDEFYERMSATSAAWVFTSATLSVNHRFSYFKNRLGLRDTEDSLLESPFDFRNNARLYLPKISEEPNTFQYLNKVLIKAIPVIKAAQGRTFFLFTSYRALEQAKIQLESQLDYNLYVQGSAPRDELLNKFREDGHGVLLGTSSFWEGVDVKGAALSCVIIDKLPFASPQDPLTQARISALNASGANAFRVSQLPQAIIMLRQGVGRLIRDISDKGVIMVCDPRLLSKPYGKIILSSLPAMPIITDENDAIRFLESLNLDNN